MMLKTHPILSIEVARAWESGILGDEPARIEKAMHNAGHAIGCAVYEDFRELREWPEVPRILVLCGKGLNTGDALVACETLYGNFRDMKVRLVLSSPASDLNPLAASALERLRSRMADSLSEISIEAYLEDPDGPFDVVFDGLYGLGFRPPLRPEAEALLKQVNRRRDIGMRAAIDLPSGIGAESDPGAFVADFTYIPGVAKAPCFMPANRGHTGRLRFLEVEPFRDAKRPSTDGMEVVPADAYKALNLLREAQSDKRSHGHCLILAGSPDMPGAALMATRAALQAGAGLVTTLTPATVINRISGAVPEAMWRALPLGQDGALDPESVRIAAQAGTRAGAMLMGPGLAMDRATLACICRIIRESQLPLVLDASALSRETLTAITGRTKGAGPVVLTPHRGEYARIVGAGGDPDDPETLKRFCERHRIIILLKGSPNWASDGKRLLALPCGGPVLARGGTGDLLSGMLTAILARHPEAPLEAAVMAATWHGAAADSLARENGAVAVRSTQLLDHLAASLRRYKTETTTEITEIHG